MPGDGMNPSHRIIALAARLTGLTEFGSAGLRKSTRRLGAFLREQPRVAFQPGEAGRIAVIGEAQQRRGVKLGRALEKRIDAGKPRLADADQRGLMTVLHIQETRVNPYALALSADTTFPRCANFALCPAHRAA